MILTNLNITRGYLCTLYNANYYGSGVAAGENDEHGAAGGNKSEIA